MRPHATRSGDPEFTTGRRAWIPAVLALLLSVALVPSSLNQSAHAEQADAAIYRVAAASLATGAEHSCALLATGSVRCWGNNYYGQLGSATNSGTDTPNHQPLPAVPLGANAISIAAGTEHTCALLTDGKVRCWGSNERGQLGSTLNSGTPLENPVPLPAVPLDAKAVAITAGANFTCALLADGTVRCWGNNDFGALGGTSESIAPNPDPLPPVALGKKATAITAGTYHACALLVGGTVRCWGLNEAGQLGSATGSGTANTHVDPLDPVLLGTKATAISAGASHTCALSSAGAVRCWGLNAVGQLGSWTYNGQQTAIPAPEPAVPLEAKASAITAGEDFTCALLDHGAIHCWGNNIYGQLGSTTSNGAADPVPDPQPAVSLLQPSSAPPAVAVSAGGGHACAVLSTGAMRCWGSNQVGQLGGTTRLGTSAAVPRPEPTAIRDVQVRAGSVLTLKAKPRTVRHAPYNWLVSGTVSSDLPADSTICAGTVRVTIARRSKTLTTTSTALTSDCRWATTVKLKKKALKSGTNNLTIEATLETTPNLAKATGRTKVRAVK